MPGYGRFVSTVDAYTVGQVLGGVLGATLAIFLIVLPTIVAFARKTQNRRKLALANVLLFWVPFALLVILIVAFASPKEHESPGAHANEARAA